MRIARSISYAENRAMEAWRERHPERPWPLDFEGVEPDRGFDYTNYVAPQRTCPTVAEVAEAETLVKAIEEGQLPSSVMSSGAEVGRRVDLLTAAFGPRVFEDWRADWSQWRIMSALNRPEEDVLAVTDRLLESGKVTLPARDPIADLLATPTGKSAIGGGGVPENLRLPNFGLLSDMVSMYKEYIGVLPPKIALHNLISFRNGLVREKANPKLIKDVNLQIGELAMDYRHYWDED